MKTPKSKLKLGDTILVEWVDQSYCGDVLDLQLDIPTKEALGKTIMHFLEENDGWISGAAERFVIDRKVSYRHVFSFPKVCITKITKL